MKSVTVMPFTAANELWQGLFIQMVMSNPVAVLLVQCCCSRITMRAELKGEGELAKLDMC